MIIFGLMFFVKNSTSDIVLEKKINKIYGDFLTSTNIKEVVNGCLVKTTQEGVLLIGLQGGRIYDYQIEDGYHIASFEDVIPFNFTGRNPNGTIYNVSYGIKARTIDLPHKDEDYPYPGSLVEWPYLSFEKSKLYENNPYAHLFALYPLSVGGQRPLLPALCNTFGINRANITYAGQTCETYSPVNDSVQEYLNKYISQKLESCINFTFKVVSNYNISSGNLSADVLVGDNDIIVFLNYPLTLSAKNKPPITKNEEFNIRPKIRLKLIHEAASHLIGRYPGNNVKADADNIFFNITGDDPSDCFNGASPCLVNGISASKLTDYCIDYFDCNLLDKHYNYSDILVIEDDKSIIDGKPFRFQFAIENRRPALDFIDESVGADTYYNNYLKSVSGGKNASQLYNKPNQPISTSYNVIFTTPGSAYLYPLGLDPDEDELTYTYDYVGTVGGFTQVSNNALIQSGGAGTGDSILRVNVSDNEGLYDYQDVVIRII
ncbi:MAG: hypothetical protein KKC75_00450 [Nanoarchaeota archaeon]|nr:hypothetical protein [Nanoarchaeota archaeon]